MLNYENEAVTMPVGQWQAYPSDVPLDMLKEIS